MYKRQIREAEQNDPVLRGRVIHGVADPAIFDESRGESIAAMMERSPNSVFYTHLGAKIWKDSTCPDGLSVFGTLWPVSYTHLSTAT